MPSLNAVGDFNGDGALNFVVASLDGTLTVALQQIPAGRPK